MQFAIKTALSALIIATVSTVSKRSPLFGSLIVSLPLTSMLAMIWLYGETRSVDQVASLSRGIFWMVLPSLVFFLAMSIFLKNGMAFPPSMVLSSAIMIASYWGYVKLLTHYGVHI
ncbi:MAG TPA: DUF3147 family protein [Bacillota bacterium]|nr:DUF3147 family protein [Bacillota bacterium]